MTDGYLVPLIKVDVLHRGGIVSFKVGLFSKKRVDLQAQVGLSGKNTKGCVGKNKKRTVRNQRVIIFA